MFCVADDTSSVSSVTYSRSIPRRTVAVRSSRYTPSPTHPAYGCDAVTARSSSASSSTPPNAASTRTSSLAKRAAKRAASVSPSAMPLWLSVNDPPLSHESKRSRPEEPCAAVSPGEILSPILFSRSNDGIDRTEVGLPPWSDSIDPVPTVWRRRRLRPFVGDVTVFTVLGGTVAKADPPQAVDFPAVEACLGSTNESPAPASPLAPLALLPPS